MSFLDNCRSRLGNSVFSKKADNVTSLEQRAKPMKQTPNCCICGNLVEVKMHEGKVYWNQGENALPVKDGRCCLKCNWEIVVPARLNKANDEFDNLV